MENFKGTTGKWNIDITETQLVITNEKETQAIAFLPLFNEQSKANSILISQAPMLLEDHETDIVLIEDFIKRYKNGETKEVVYFLELLLTSKRANIKKATQI